METEFSWNTDLLGFSVNPLRKVARLCSGHGEGIDGADLNKTNVLVFFCRRLGCMSWHTYMTLVWHKTDLTYIYVVFIRLFLRFHSDFRCTAFKILKKKMLSRLTHE